MAREELSEYNFELTSHVYVITLNDSFLSVSLITLLKKSLSNTFYEFGFLYYYWVLFDQLAYLHVKLSNLNFTRPQNLKSSILEHHLN